MVNDDTRPLFGRSAEETGLYLEELSRVLSKKREFAKANPEKSRAESAEFLMKIGVITEPV